MNSIAAVRASVERASKALARQLGLPAIAAAITTLADGRRAMLWGLAGGATPDDAMRLAGSILDQVAEDAAKGAVGCEGCLDRYTRCTEAAKALRAAGRVHEHLH